MFGFKGVYRDIISRNGQLLEDRGWRSNKIVADFGLFLAALMKKDFSKQVGLEYLAVGQGSDNETDFKTRMESLFAGGGDPLPIYEDAKGWIWAKRIEAVSYLQDDQPTQEVSNELEITITMPPGTPSSKTLDFSEFALVGIEENINNNKLEFNIEKLFLVNYVEHGVITKDELMSLDRTIQLKFPMESPET